MAKTKVGNSATAFLQKAVALPQENVSFKESFEVKRPAATSSFRGMFGDSELSEAEKNRLKRILHDFNDAQLTEENQLEEDLDALSKITTEIKAISNQSILLHGERIKKAQSVLKNYKEGAFTQWLIATYGNRQTPYSILQYYELYQALPAPTRPLIENLPKKAAYVLAAREGNLDKKLEIIQNCQGDKQSDIILHIQAVLPLDTADKRRRKTNPSLVLDEIERQISKLEQCASLSNGHRMRIREIATRLKACQ